MISEASYSAALRDDDGASLADLDVTVEYEVAGWSEPVFEVRAIFMDRMTRRDGRWVKDGFVNLLLADAPHLRSLGYDILDQIERDQDWQGDRIAEAGWRYEGHPMNPGSRWVASRVREEA